MCNRWVTPSSLRCPGTTSSPLCGITPKQRQASSVIAKLPFDNIFLVLQKIISDYGRRRLLNSSPRLTTPEREREAGSQLKINHVNTTASLLVVSNQHTMTQNNRRLLASDKRDSILSESDPLLSAAREQLSRPSRDLSIEKAPRQSVPNAAQNAFRMSRHMSIGGSRERVAVPFPVTNLLGCPIEEPTDLTVIRYRQ